MATRTSKFPEMALLLVAYYKRERGQDSTAEVRRFVTAKLNASA